MKAHKILYLFQENQKFDTVPPYPLSARVWHLAILPVSTSLCDLPKKIQGIQKLSGKAEIWYTSSLDQDLETLYGNLYNFEFKVPILGIKSRKIAKMSKKCYFARFF